MHQKNQNLHIPVLLSEVLEVLNPTKGDTYLDVTAGYGGHARVVTERTLQANNAVLVDRDKNAIDVLRSDKNLKGAEVIHHDYQNASQELLQRGCTFQMILADLGLSSPHLNTASRGFSIVNEGPLDMRMDESQTKTAANIVNTMDEANLADLIYEFGEEPKSRQIAHLIVENRPFETTRQLARVVARAWPASSKIHPATRTFQALRIAVNSELEQLANSLPIWLDLLAPGGRLAIISFHSLEDRIVKQFLSENAQGRYSANLKLLTKKPIMASPTEIVHNPRARSAKLRAAVKIKTERG